MSVDGEENYSISNSSAGNTGNNEYHRYDLKVYVTGVDAGDITSRLNGYFTLNGKRIRFQGIAFGRIGGHNIYVKISKRAEELIRSMGYDPEQVLVMVQRRIIEGECEIKVR